MCTIILVLLVLMLVYIGSVINSRLNYICSDLFNRPYLSLHLTLNEVSGYPREIQYKVVSYIICGRLRK